jgi:hypothetical protein
MKPRSLSSLVAGFKSAVTKHINRLRGVPETPVWQRNYYEHVIRLGLGWLCGVLVATPCRDDNVADRV